MRFNDAISEKFQNLLEWSLLGGVQVLSGFRPDNIEGNDAKGLLKVNATSTIQGYILSEEANDELTALGFRRKPTPSIDTLKEARNNAEQLHKASHDDSDAALHAYATDVLTALDVILDFEEGRPFQASGGGPTPAFMKDLLGII